MGTQIDELKAELENELENFPNSVVRSRTKLIEKLLLAEEVKDESLQVLHSTIGASGKVLYEVTTDLGKQKSLLQGASVTDIENWDIPSTFAGSVNSLLVTPTTSAFAYELSVGGALSSNPLDSNYYGNFFLTKHTTDNKLSNYLDITQTLSPGLKENNNQDIANILLESNGINSTFVLSSSDASIYYTSSSTEIAEIRLSDERIGYIDKFGDIYNDNNQATESVTIDNDNSTFIINDNNIILKFTQLPTSGTDLPLTLVFTEDQSDYSSTATEILDYNYNNGTHYKELVNDLAPKNSKIVQDGQQIALIDDSLNIISMKVNNRSSFIDNNLIIGPTTHNYDLTVITVEYTTLVLNEVQKTIGTLKTDTYDLTSLTSSSTMKVDNVYDGGSQDATKKIVRGSVNILFNDVQAATSDSSGTITGSYDGLSISGTITDYDLTTLDITGGYPSADTLIKLEYSYLEKIDTFEGTYTALPISSISTNTDNNENTNVLNFSAVGTKPKLGEILYLRKLDDYSIYSQIVVVSKGLQKKAGWDWTTSADGKDALTITDANFKPLMAWMNPDNTDDIIQSANPDNISSGAKTGEPDTYGDLYKNPFFPTTDGTADASSVIKIDYNHKEERYYDPDVENTLVWQTLSKKRWTCDVNPRVDNGRNSSFFTGGSAPGSTLPSTGDINGLSFHETLDGDLTTITGFTGDTTVTIPTSDIAYPGVSVLGTEKQYRMNDTTYKIEERTAGTPPAWGAWSDFTCWWNDFIDLYTTEYTHFDSQVSKLNSLGDTQDPNTDNVEDDNFWTAVGDIIGSSEVSTFKSNYTNIIAYWADIDASGFDVTVDDSGNGQYPVKTNFNSTQSGDLTSFYDSSFHVSTGRYKQITDRIGDVTGGYSKDVYNAINVMLGSDIAIVKDPINEYYSMGSLYTDFTSKKTKYNSL